MLRVAICDDEQNIAEELNEYLLEIQKMLCVEMKTWLFFSAEDLEYEVFENAPFDIVILDIEIKGVNGISLGEKIKKSFPMTVIIFMTGYSQYIYDAFRAQPCGFINKPINRGKIESTFCRAVALCDNVSIYRYESNGNIKSILLKDILYFTSSNRKIIIMSSKGEDSYYGKLDEVNAQLDELGAGFIRVSQSVIVNFRYIAEINYSSVTIKIENKEWRFNISQSYRGSARQRYLELWKS